MDRVCINGHDVCGLIDRSLCPYCEDREGKELWKMVDKKIEELQAELSNAEAGFEKSLEAREVTAKTIQQLQEDFDKADDACNAALRAKVYATDALCTALIEKGQQEFAARGITPGTKVIGKPDREKYAGGDGQAVFGIYIGHARAGWIGNKIQAEPIVRKIKKNGTAHAGRNVRNWYWTIWEKAE